MARLPTLPGVVVAPDRAHYLRGQVSALLGLQDTRFPGSQPVSFKTKDLQRLENENYWVCEKSDGIRVLVLILLWPPNDQEVYLIDRKNEYRLVEGMYFPHFENPMSGLGTTLLDGELVLDVDPATGHETLRLLCFDCIAVNGQSIMSKTLTSRYGKLKEWVYRPFDKMMKDIPSMAASLPFDIKVKQMDLSYTIEHVLKEVVPKLQHGHDGLIYTCATSTYVVGTDERILKWKPPSENSVDFKLELRFPPLPNSRAGEVDVYAKPVFVLMQWCGGQKYEFFDTMDVDDDEWEKIKQSREQYDDRVIEVAWDSDKKNWRMMRFRDDKEHGNHRSVVESVISSILDGVEVDALVNSAQAVRTAWKARESRGQPGPQGNAPSQQQHHHLPPPPPQQQPRRLMYTPAVPNEYTRVGGPVVVSGMSR